MEMQLLLEKTRTLHQLLQKSAGQILDYDTIAGEVSRLLEASVYIADKNGNLLGKGELVTIHGGIFPEEELLKRQFSESSQQWLLALHIQKTRAARYKFLLYFNTGGGESGKNGDSYLRA